MSVKNYRYSPNIPAVTSQDILARLDEIKLKVKGYFVYVTNVLCHSNVYQVQYTGIRYR